MIGVITVVLFGGAMWISSISSSNSNEGVELLQNIKGNSEASVSLVEYSDFQCPACAAFQPVVEQIMTDLSNEVRFEYKHFPLPIHQNALAAAIAAEAAGQQGKFFEFHDVLFAKQSEWSVSPVPGAVFAGYASDLGLDLDQFKLQSKSSMLRDKVRDEFSEGRELGVTGTPTFFLNGQRMQFQTYDEFIQQVMIAVDPSLVPEVEGTEPANSGIKFGL